MLPRYIFRLMGIAFEMYNSATGNGKVSGEVLKSTITLSVEEGNCEGGSQQVCESERVS